MPGASDSQFLRFLRERDCVQPFLTDDGQYVRCGTRDASACPSCAELYSNDVSAIFRSGLFDPPPGTPPQTMLLLTLTAPSFGPVHNVPRPSSDQLTHCQCGGTHSATIDAHLRGVPLDIDAYDYDSAVAWNNGVGPLWDATRARLHRLLGDFDYAATRESQLRGALHLHVLIRCPATAVSSVMIAMEAQRATATVPWSGVQMRWGEQVDCQLLSPGTSDAANDAAASTVWYLGKALTYSIKSLGRPKLDVPNSSGIGIVHLHRLSQAQTSGS